MAPRATGRLRRPADCSRRTRLLCPRPSPPCSSSASSCSPPCSSGSAWACRAAPDGSRKLLRPRSRPRPAPTSPRHQARRACATGSARRAPPCPDRSGRSPGGERSTTRHGTASRRRCSSPTSVCRRRRGCSTSCASGRARRGSDDPEQLVALLREEIVDDLSGADRDLHHAPDGPTVWLFVGVNGTGKTTTIAKLARREIDDGRPALLAAADTFRAAAADQLAHWAERVGADVVRGQEGADPGSVVFDAVDAAAGRGADVVLVDTAGRMHTKVNLMEELKKIRRIAERTPGAPQEVLLVIDATTGQNGLAQARQFAEAVGVTGVVLTKLDGTAKGGIVLAIEVDLGIPVKLVGVGEAPEDLVPFDPAEFVAALLRQRLRAGACDGERVRRPGRPLRRHLQASARPRPAERQGRRRGRARDPRRAARGRRQRDGRQVVHQPRQGTRARRRGREEPEPRAAGHQDRPRRARDDARRRDGQAHDELQTPDRRDARRPAGLGEDDRCRQARAPPRRRRAQAAAGRRRPSAAGGGRAAARARPAHRRARVLRADRSRSRWRGAR